jgi:hypothetical protein
MATAARASDSALPRRILWVSLLTVATVGGTLLVGCATPFAGLAALAALFLPRRDAFVLIGATWVLNQVIGYGLLHYPLNWDSLAGGVDLGVASLGCTAAAILVFSSLRKTAFPLAVVGVFAAAFVAYEGLTWVLSIGRHAGDYTPSVILYILYLNGLAFAGLFLLQKVAEAIGVSVPRTIRQPADAHTPAVS